MSDSLDDVKRRSSKRVAQAASAAATLASQAANANKRVKEDDTKKKPRKSTPVDFAKLEMASLLKYKRHFKLPVRPNASKNELISAARKHFLNHPRLKDFDVLSSFLFANQKYMKQLQAQANRSH
jgi:hypothetical protein